jgi:hypothetical protein
MFGWQDIGVIAALEGSGEPSAFGALWASLLLLGMEGAIAVQFHTLRVQHHCGMLQLFSMASSRRATL